MQPELQLTHRRAKRDFLDRAVTRTAGTGIGARGHTSSTAFLGVGEVQRRVIEDVERVHLELQVEALRKPEVLRYRHVVGEYSRSPHLAKTGVADLTFARIEPHAAGRGRSEERYRVGEGIESLDSVANVPTPLLGRHGASELISDPQLLRFADQGRPLLQLVVSVICQPLMM